MAAREYLEEVSALRVTLSAIEQVLNLPKLEADFKSLEAEASAPNLWDDPEKAQVVTSKLSRVQATLNKSNTIRRRLEDIPLLLELAQGEKDQSAIADAGNELDDVTRAIRELEVQTLLSGEYDDRDCLITIRSEAGGVEAADWAQMLMRMYLRYCERHSFKVDVLGEEDLEHLKDLASEAPVIKMVNLIMQRAVETRASDIHIEPFEQSLKVRLRVDGVFQNH